MAVKKTFAEWSKDPSKDSPVTMQGASTIDTKAITLSRDKGKARDELAALFAGAPSSVREAAMDSPSDGLSDIVASFTISTARVDSYNTTFAVEGWDVEDFRKNPVVLFGHDSWGCPIGRDIGVHVLEDKTALKGVARFVDPSLDEEGYKVAKMVRAGLINGASIRFDPIEWEYNLERPGQDSWMRPVDFKRQRLTEWSVVVLPSNLDCVIDEARMRSAQLTKKEINSMFERSLGGQNFLLAPKEKLEELALKTRSSMTFDMGALGKFTLQRADAVVDEAVATAEAEKAKAEADAAQMEGGEKASATEDNARAEMGVCPECGHEGEIAIFIKPAEASAEGEAVDDGVAEDEVVRNLSDEKLLAILNKRNPELLAGIVNECVERAQAEDDDDDLSAEEIALIAHSVADAIEKQEAFEKRGKLA